MNTTVLAYLGDAVYEVYVREMVIQTGQIHADRLHYASVKYVRAEAQAKAVKAMFDELTEPEQGLVKRARNKKITSRPKNVDPRVYKWATAHEALIGYLHLTGQKERLEEILKRTIELMGDGETGSRTAKKGADHGGTDHSAEETS